VEERINRVIEKLLMDDIREECIDYIDERDIEDIVLFLRTGERRKSKLVECMGGYDEIRRLSELL
jgi:hypothetical protein